MERQEGKRPRSHHRTPGPPGPSNSSLSRNALWWPSAVTNSSLPALSAYYIIITKRH